MFDTTDEVSSRGMRALCLTERARGFLQPAFVAGIFLFSLVAVQFADAAPINYGTFAGNTVTYVDVTEDSNSGDTLPLFGAPIVSGDSIDFNPVGFDANATGAAGNDITSSQLSFMVVAQDPFGSDFGITNINFSEAGDTTIAGVGSDLTMTSVTATVIININEVDGAGINTVTVPAALTFTPSGGTYGLGTDGGGGPVFHTAWSGSLFVDLNAALIANNVPFDVGATKISVDISNSLAATSENGTFAVIAKKDFGGVSVTVNMPDPGEIPEPGTLALLGLGVIGLLTGRRMGR